MLLSSEDNNGKRGLTMGRDIKRITVHWQTPTWTVFQPLGEDGWALSKIAVGKKLGPGVSIQML